MFRLFIFLFSFKVAFGQFVESANKFNLSIPVPNGWTIEQQSIFHKPGENEKLFVQLVKQKQDTSKSYLKVVITYNEEQDVICDFGTLLKIDTVNVSGFKAKRSFAENCGWHLSCSAPPGTVMPIVAYSLDYLIKVNEKKFLKINSEYFSRDENQREQFKDEIIYFVNTIKIKSP